MSKSILPPSPLAAVVVAGRAFLDALEALPPPVVEAGDELRPIADLAEEWSLERAGLEGAIKRAGVRTVKIGRARCVRRRDVVGLVDALAEKATPVALAPPEADPYRALVERHARRGRR